MANGNRVPVNLVCSNCGVGVTSYPHPPKPNETILCSKCYKQGSGKGKNKNAGKRGQMCPLCNQREVSEGKQACLVCVPEPRITCNPCEVLDEWNLVFQAYLKKQEGQPFWYSVERRGYQEVRRGDPKYRDFFKRGVLVVSVPFSSQEVSVNFGLLEFDKDAEEPVKLPSRKVRKVVVNLFGPGPSKKLTAWENFKAGFKAGRNQKRK